jgi:hypothetical protein
MGEEGWVDMMELIRNNFITSLGSQKLKKKKSYKNSE